MKKGDFYIGNLREDGLKGNHRGWVVGTFMEEVPRKTKHVELMYWEFPVGKTSHPTKTSETLEITMVFKGKVLGEVAGEKISLEAGQYIVISPKVINNLVKEVVEKTQAVTIKAPSDPKAKKVIA